MYIDLRAPITISSIRRSLHDFFEWWQGQLLACLPQTCQVYLDEVFRVPLLSLGEGAWLLTGYRATGASLSIDPNKPSGESSDLLDSTSARALENGVDVQLPENDVLIRHITLPAAAIGRLRSVVRLQLDRLSPFRGDDVSFDCQSEGFNEDGTVRVEVAIISKNTLYDYEKKLRSMGLTPRSFKIPTSSLHFSPKGIPWSKPRQLHVLLAASGLILWIAALWFAPAAREAEIADLGSQISSMRLLADKAQAERRELGGYVLPREAISPDRERALDILATLTHYLPSDTHLTDLEIDSNLVRLTGTAISTQAVETSLRRSKLFGSITAPNTAASLHGNEFRLEAHLLPTRTADRY
jgi:hypothetical protein